MAKSERYSRRTYQEPPRFVHPVIYVMQGAGVSILVSLLFSVFLATISLITDLASIERYMSYILTGAMVCSVFIGSVYAAQRSGTMGLLIGAGVGIVYMLVSALFDMQISGEDFAVFTLLFMQKALTAISAGALGGIVGTNL